VHEVATDCDEALSPTDDAAAYHFPSPPTCKVLAGLCFAAEALGARAFVAVAHEDALVRWRALGAARGALPRGRAWALAQWVEGWAHGLPPHYAQAARAWPPFPRPNGTYVLSPAVARSLCALHRAAPLLMHGPAEAAVGMLLHTLEGVHRADPPAGAWGDAGEGAGAGAPACPQGLAVRGMTPRAWAACAAAA